MEKISLSQIDSPEADSDMTMFKRKVRSTLDIALHPIVEIHTGETYGQESLMRNSEGLGFSTAQELFDYSNATGSLQNLEIILSDMAAKKFSEIEGADRQKLFLNVDGRLLEKPNFLNNNLDRLAAKFNIAASNLCLELSEKYDNASASYINQVVQHCFDRGYRVAIDDYGMGVSELKVLYEFQPDYVKIDRFFINGIDRDSRKRIFVSTVVDLAHLLGQKVIAEGVETKAELLASRDVGCDLVQGFFVCKPQQDSCNMPSTYHHIANIHDRRRRNRDSELDLVKNEIQRLETLTEGTEMVAVLEQFVDNSRQTFFPVVDGNQEPRGIIAESDLRKLIYSSYGKDLLRNTFARLDLNKFMRRCAVADIGSDTDRLIELLSDETSEGIIITKGMKYEGFITAYSLAKLANQKRVRLAQEQNPLTKLPGNSVISEFVTAAAEKSDQDRYLCYMDFDNFKPFNDLYGFRVGDRAILLFAELMRKLLFEEGFTLGHIGGDDFFAGVAGMDADKVSKLMSQLAQNFARDAESFYEPEHRTAGYIESKSRLGGMARFPLLTCSIGTIRIPANLDVGDCELLTRQIAKLKQCVKESDQIFLFENFGETIDHPQLQTSVISAA